MVLQCVLVNRGARPGRACAHGGHAGWVSWASVGFGEPGSVLTQFFLPDFDLVLFLSQFWGKIFQKKKIFKIK